MATDASAFVVLVRFPGKKNKGNKQPDKPDLDYLDQAILCQAKHRMRFHQDSIYRSTFYSVREHFWNRPDACAGDHDRQR